MKIQWKFWGKTTPKNPPPTQSAPQVKSHLDWLIMGVVILVLGLLIGSPARKVLWSIPWGSVGLVILLLAILGGILYALTTKPEWRKKAGSKWKPILALVAIASLVGLGIFGVKKYRSSVKGAQAEKIKADSVWARQLATNSLILRDTTYLAEITVSAKWSPVIIPQLGYCVRTEPKNRSQSYQYATRFDTLTIVPGQPVYGPEVESLRFGSPFSLRALGSRQTTILVWHEKVDRHGQCPTEHLKLDDKDPPQRQLRRFFILMYFVRVYRGRLLGGLTGPIVEFNVERIKRIMPKALNMMSIPRSPKMIVLFPCRLPSSESALPINFAIPTKNTRKAIAKINPMIGLTIA